MKSIISRIKQKGISAIKDESKRITYADLLSKINSGNNDYKLIEIVDNQEYPKLSHSHNCQMPNCNKKIRYEYIFVNDNKEELVIGSECAKTILSLPNKSELSNLEKEYKKNSELKKWQKDNRDLLEKLELFKKKEIPIFVPFWKAAQIHPLSDEDMEYIKYTNTKMTLKNKELLDEILKIKSKLDYHSLDYWEKRLTLNYKNTDEQYEEIKNRIKQAKTWGEKKTRFEVTDSYAIKDFLKERGYWYDGDKKTWYKFMKNNEVKEEKNIIQKLLREANQ